MRERNWVFAESDRAASAHLAHSLNVSALTATLLVNRGVRETADARRFLHPDLASLVNPMKFNDMAAAIDRLESAVKKGEKIGIFGDYDVDGTTGTAILFRILDLLGRKPSYRVPHRVTDGYGLNAAAVEAFAAEGVTLLITVDCGTNDVEEVALAKQRGMDVIVVDHHEAGPVLPPALALLNPKLRDSTYGFTGICSSGISFKLAWALADRTDAKRLPGFEGFILDAMGLAALGTVADVCPLMAENRIYVRYGLDALRSCRSRGLRALLDLANLEGKPLETFDISFKLAPRLNALGRLGTAMDCVELLVSDDPVRIGAILKVLEKSNRNRKSLEDDNFDQACEQVEKGNGGGDAIIVADERWHVGVVGIVAARLVDRYYRPSFVLAVEDGVARGSARTIEGLPLHVALETCRDLLITGGGHAMAAGLSLRVENLEAFRRRMLRHVGSLLTPESLQPRLELDDEVPLASLTRPVVRELERLAPHGAGNPVPTLAVSHAKVAGEPRLIGKRNNHLTFFLTQGGAGLRAVGFGMGGLLDPLKRARSVSVAFTPQINEWQGSETVELHLKDMKFDA